MNVSSSKTRRALALGAVAAIGAIFALVTSTGTERSPEPRDAPSAPAPRSAGPPAKAPPAGSAELALLAPVAPGSSFEGWTVRSVSKVHEGSIRIELDRGSERATLTVHAAKGGPPPPATAGPYAVYYSAKSATEGDRLARALAAVLSRHLDLPVPAGLAGFREEGHTL